MAAGLAGAGLAALVAAAPLTGAAAAAVPDTAANRAAGWLGRHLSPDGYLESGTTPGAADLGATAQAVLAFAATGYGRDEASRALAYLGSHVDDYVKVGGVDAPGPLATLILAVDATGGDPRTFAGEDLVARLEATQQASGLYGSADPTYDGAYRQGLALAALAAAGVDDADGVAWLRDQQCDDGSWVAYRSDTSAPCPAPDPANFTGPDTNSTALAVMGLAAQDAPPAHDPLAWFDATQGASGGWAFIGDPSSPPDANSTALAIQGIIAAGGDPAAARFTTAGGGNAFSALSSFQLDCADSPTDAGAFAYQPNPDGSLDANVIATVQSVPAAAGKTFPLPAVTLQEGLAPAPCAQPAPAGPTTTVATAGSASAGSRGAAPASVRRRGSLARTGAGAAPLAAAGVALVLGGGAVLGLARRREDEPA